METMINEIPGCALAPSSVSQFVAPNGSIWANSQDAALFFYEENRLNSDALNCVVKLRDQLKIEVAKMREALEAIHMIGMVESSSRIAADRMEYVARDALADLRQMAKNEGLG